MNDVGRTTVGAWVAEGSSSLLLLDKKPCPGFQDHSPTALAVQIKMPNL